MQEIFGVNHHIRDMADRFVALGYAVVASALFDRAQRDVELGYTQDDIGKGRDIRMKLSDADVMKDIEAAADHIKGKQLGIVGYCFGGTVAWWGATRTTKFSAASCWYGGGSPGTKNESPHCPVQMHFGEKDASIPMTDVDAVRAAQPKVEVYVYEARSTASDAMSAAASASPTMRWPSGQLSFLLKTSRLTSGGNTAVNPSALLN